jgi:hypothetical protein
VLDADERETWPRFRLDDAVGPLGMTDIKSQFVRDLISNNQICDLKRHLIWTRKQTREWSFLLNAKQDMCIVDEPLIAFSNLPKVLKSGRKTFTVSCISDSLFCDCSSQSIEIPSCIKTITHKWKDTNNTIQRIEISEWIENIGGFWDFEHLQTVVFQQNCHVREIGGFRYCDSLNRIEIPMSIEVIDDQGFYDCKSLREVVFSSNSYLRTISGFQYCRSLCRIDIPPSVEVITWTGFSHCTALAEVNISTNSQLNEVFGFHECTSLHRFCIPALREKFERGGLVELDCLNEAIFQSRVKIETMVRFIDCLRSKPTPDHIFIAYEDDTFVKNSRQRVHVGTCLGHEKGTRSGDECSPSRLEEEEEEEEE